jgi:ubiquilin
MAAGGGMSGMQGLGGMDPNTINQMMNNPMVQSMLTNPAMLDQIVNSNPMLR